MNTCYRILFLALLVFVLASCEHQVAMETTVHEDGTQDKVIVFENDDPFKNILGVSEKTGWKKSVQPKGNVPDSAKDKEFISTFTKSFNSAEEANTELASANDTLFRVTSTFKKDFRWFYTYLYYADTYHKINRMSYPPDDYFTPEDYAFIARLPKEGAKISKADDNYLDDLTKKIYDNYGIHAIYEEYHRLNIQIIKQHNLDNRWIDTLNQHKEDILNLMTGQTKGFEDALDEVRDERVLLNAMRKFAIPLPYDKLLNEYPLLARQIEAKTNFISYASNAKYTHKINMPWSVVRTNADSTSGNSLFWNPPVIKFLLSDYTLYAESRKLNYWAVITSALIVGFTGYVFIRRKKRA